jgi:hypothetical protein
MAHKSAMSAETHSVDMNTPVRPEIFGRQIPSRPMKSLLIHRLDDLDRGG